jgi:organic radical activating enzyme
METRHERTRTALCAPVMEVFASIQGEGLFVGEPQVLLRLFGCPLRCRWCDTPGSLRVQGAAQARVDAAAEHGGPRREDAWATPFQAATWIAEVDPEKARAVSVTGGEPLVWDGFVRALQGFLGGRRLHLETAGAHPEALARTIDAVDHTSLDLKLPEDMDAPEELTGAAAGAPRDAMPRDAVPRDAVEWSRVRAAVLEIVRDRDACAKIIVAGGHPPARFVPLFADVAEIAPALPVFLQPVTPCNGVAAPTRAELETLVGRALEHGLRVRVVPQVHRVLGVR